MQQELEATTCNHYLSAIRCALFFSDRDKPKSQAALREYLRREFPIERRRPETVGSNTVEGFRPRRAYFTANETSFVWQEGGAVYLQSETPHDRCRFLQLLDAVIQVCASARPLNVEPLQLEITARNRFEFSPFNVDLFELHKYFSIVPQPSAEIIRQKVFLFQGEINLRHGDYNGDYIGLCLKYPAYGPGGSNGLVDLTITAQDPCVWSLDEASNSAHKAFNIIEELTLETTSPELHQILNWT